MQGFEPLYPTRESLGWHLIKLPLPASSLADSYTGGTMPQDYLHRGIWWEISSYLNSHRSENGRLALCRYEFLPAPGQASQTCGMPLSCFCHALCLFHLSAMSPPPSAKVSSGSRDFCVFPPRPMDFFESRLSSFRKALL